MEGIALTGAWVDKEHGLLSLIVLEMGVSSRLVRLPEDGRAGRRHGADRHADRDSRERRTCCCSAAASATPCCSRSPRRMRERGQPGDLLRRLQEGRGPLQARGHRGRDRSGDLEHRHRRGDRTAAGRRTRTSAATSCRRWSPTRTASSATAARAAADGRSHHRDRLGPDDGRGEGGAPRRARAVPQAGARRHRQHQLADAVHDEGGLRAVPAEARRSGDRQGRRSSSPASTRTRSWTASTSRTWPRACARTRCRRSWRTCGSTTSSGITTFRASSHEDHEDTIYESHAYESHARSGFIIGACTTARLNSVSAISSRPTTMAWPRACRPVRPGAAHRAPGCRSRPIGAHPLRGAHAERGVRSRTHPPRVPLRSRSPSVTDPICSPRSLHSSKPAWPIFAGSPVPRSLPATCAIGVSSGTRCRSAFRPPSMWPPTLSLTSVSASRERAANCST